VNEREEEKKEKKNIYVHFPLLQKPFLEHSFEQMAPREHASPQNPGAQKHVPFKHTPLLLHSSPLSFLGQVSGVRQSVCSS
jgi:hypothetical protein